MANYLYAGSTPLDDEQPYHVDWRGSDFGAAARRPPAIQATAGGNFTVYPLPTAFQERRGRVAVYARATDFPNKRRGLAELAGILSGEVQLHLAGRYMDVVFLQAPEVDATKGLGTAFGVVAEFVAPVPFWRLNQPLRGIDSPVETGVEWDLFDDDAIPSPLPAYTFTDSEFTFDNWGTAFTWAAGTITAGPASTTVYLAGLGTTRLAIALDEDGNGSFSEADEFYLAAGEQTIRLEDVDGAALGGLGATFEISFGDTVMRFF